MDGALAGEAAGSAAQALSVQLDDALCIAWASAWSIHIYANSAMSLWIANPRTCGSILKLNSFYINNDFPPPETSGWWHARCLAESDAAVFWYEAFLRNFRDVRRYRHVAEYAEWTLDRRVARTHGRALGSRVGGVAASRARRCALAGPRPGRRRRGTAGKMGQRHQALPAGGGVARVGICTPVSAQFWL